MEVKGKVNITDMPLEILDILFRYCGDMSNKVHLGQTHPYLVQAFVYHCRHLFERVPAHEAIQLSSWRFILPVLGWKIKRADIVIRQNADAQVELSNLFAQHCSSLEKVKFYFEETHVASVNSFLCQRQNTLRAIKLDYESEKINTEMLHELPEMPLLERLNIYNISDNHLIEKFPNLVKLKIGNISYINISDLCASLKNLRELTLSVVGDVEFKQNNVQQPIIPLEKLSLRCCRIMTESPVCFNLKSLIIAENYYPEEYQYFILSQAKSLESLRFDCISSNYYYEEECLEIMRECKKLRSVKLPIESIQFDFDFVKEIVDILKENGVTPDNPLVLAVNDYTEYKYLLQWIKLSSSPDIMKGVIG